MNFEDYTLDQLTDCLFDILNNSDIPPETVVSKIKETLQDNKLDLQRKLDRTTKILNLLEKDEGLPDLFKTSENYNVTDGYEWTPGSPTFSDINHQTFGDLINYNKYPNTTDSYEHSEYYWDTDRNK